MEKNSEELKRSIEEEHALRLELQNQCMESKKQIIQQKISEQVRQKILQFQTIQPKYKFNKFQTFWFCSFLLFKKASF